MHARLLACAILLFGATAPRLSAQSPSGEPAAAEAAAAAPERLFAEFQALQGALQDVQGRALEDPALSARSAALVADVEKRMTVLEPATTARLAQLEVLQRAVDAAAEAQDAAAFQSAVSEARQVAGLLEATRSEVLAEQAYASRTEALQRQLVEAMTAIEPRVPQMLSRLNLLDRALRSAAEDG